MAVLPMPASPRRTMAPLWPPRACASSPSISSRSGVRPTNPAPRVAATAASAALRHERLSVVRQDIDEGVTRDDAQLPERLVQVPLDGAGTQEELGAYLRVRQAVAGQPCDLPLLWRELLARVGGTGSWLRTGGG